MMGLKDVSNETMSIVVYAAVKAVLDGGGYISINIVGSVAEIQISKVPMETDPVT